MRYRSTKRFSFPAAFVLSAWLMTPSIYSQDTGADFLYGLEKKTDEFFSAFKNKQFDRLLAMLSGQMKAQFEAFVDAYKKNPAAAGKEIPDRWRILGTGGDPKKGYFSYVDFRVGGGFEKFTFHWLKGPAGWTIDRMEHVQLTKMGQDGKVENAPEPIAEIHLSAAEEEKIRAAANELIRALEDWRLDAILKLIPESMREDFQGDKTDARQNRERFSGTQIHVDTIWPGKWDSEDGQKAHLELYVEHKDGVGDFVSEWELVKIEGRWRFSKMRNRMAP